MFGTNYLKSKTEALYIYSFFQIENGINLLETIAKDPIDFARQTMKLLFSKEELKTCILPPKRAHLRREPLDERRFRKVLGKNKFHLLSY